MLITSRRLLLALVVAAGAWALMPSREASGMTGRLDVDGTEFVLRLDDGRELRGDALVGAAFVIRHRGQATKIHIEGTERQATARGDVLLYRFTLRDPIGGTVAEICEPDVQGRKAGFPVSDGEGGFALTCTSGAEGKCILLGYRPWEGDGDPLPMRDLHRACIHMIRADYGGDNRPTTRDGTIIDIYDRFGIQVSEPMPDLAFEAAWGASGALCVAHPRIAEHVTLADLARYPRLAGRLGPDACSEAAMRQDPRVLLFNRSRPDTADGRP